MKNDNLIIRVLEFATNALNVEFTLKELIENVKPSEKEKKVLINLISRRELLSHNHNESGLRRTDDYEKIVLYASAEDHFRLLEFQQLKEARAASKTATWLAFSALIVSIVIGCFSIYFSKKSMKAELNLPQKLYNILEEEKWHSMRKVGQTFKKKKPLTFQ